MSDRICKPWDGKGPVDVGCIPADAVGHLVDSMPVTMTMSVADAQSQLYLGRIEAEFYWLDVMVLALLVVQILRGK